MSEEPTNILRVLADETRQRILHLLTQGGALVGELQQVLDSSQSSASAHLAKLRSIGLVHDVAEGTARRYQLHDAPPQLTSDLWQTVYHATAQQALIRSDRHRLEDLRQQDQQSWVERVAGHLDNSYAPGRTWAAIAGALVHLCSLGDCCDIGAGDGALLELLLPRCTSLTAIEPAAAMREAAEKRLSALGAPNLTIIDGRGESVPVASGVFDTVLFLQSLQFIQQPQQAIIEARRLLRPDGRLLIATLNQHDFADAGRYGHLHRGFSEKDLRNWLSDWDDIHCSLLPAEHRAPHFQPLIITAKRA
jgi:ArsR family transcriptional regulator